MKRIQRTLNDYSGDKRGLDMTALFQLMIKDGIEIFGSEIQSDWFEIDTPTDLNIAESLYNSNQLKIS